MFTVGDVHDEPMQDEPIQALCLKCSIMLQCELHVRMCEAPRIKVISDHLLLTQQRFHAVKCST